MKPKDPLHLGLPTWKKNVARVIHTEALHVQIRELEVLNPRFLVKDGSGKFLAKDSALTPKIIFSPHP